MTMHTNTFKEKLLKEKKTLEEELSTVGRQNPENPGDWEAKSNVEERPAERDEVADKLEAFEENIAIVRQLEARLGEVQAALLRIETGTFGVCTVCKKEIEEDRLMANPAATTCKTHLK